MGSCFTDYLLSVGKGLIYSLYQKKSCDVTDVLSIVAQDSGLWGFINLKSGKMVHFLCEKYKS
jgi:hypothetical protein